MEMRKILKLTCFIYFFLIFTAIQASPTTINKIVVFGDSLSDNGNLYDYTDKKMPIDPPYYKGRYSNGELWIEYVTKHFYKKSNSHLFDLAYGGATVSTDDKDTPFPLNTQIDTYLLSNNQVASQHTLYTLWIGANNYINAISDDNVQETKQARVNIVIQGINHGINQLIDAGAKVIIIPNLPDLGKTPAGKMLSENNTLSELSQLHNQALQASISTIQLNHPDVKIIPIDTYHLFGNIMDHPDSFGFKNTEDTCYDNDFSAFKSSKKIISLGKARNMNPALTNDLIHCDGFLFFDPIHPTTKAHELLGNIVLAALDDANVIVK
jgi:phospholipase/lecithinase/hemolysin